MPLFSGTGFSPHLHILEGTRQTPQSPPSLPPHRKVHRHLASFLHKGTDYIVVKMGSGETIIKSSSKETSVDCNCLQDFGNQAKKMPARMVKGGSYQFCSQNRHQGIIVTGVDSVGTDFSCATYCRERTISLLFFLPRAAQSYKYIWKPLLQSTISEIMKQ